MEQTNLVIWHLNRDLAVANGLGSNTEHRFPLADATFGGFKRHEEAVRVLWEHRCYEPVATLVRNQPMDHSDMSALLEAAFYYTNSRDESWMKGSHVATGTLNVIGRRSACRSTSVGDVVQVIDNHTTRFFYVASVGFKPLTDWSTIKEAK